MHVTSTDAHVVERRLQRLPDHLRRHVVAQQHEEYTAEEHEVWSETLARNTWVVSAWEGRLHPAYVNGIRALRLPRGVPRVEEINKRLEPTGWQIACVNGYIPPSSYAALMSARLFPMSRRIRQPEHLDYSPEPDLVHDIIGHLPMLFSADHREFLHKLAIAMGRASTNDLDEELYVANQRLGELKRRHAPADDVVKAEASVVHVQSALRTNASELTLLARMYLWSVEFGLMGLANAFGIYGAALTSSPTEISAVCEGRATVLPYSIDVVQSDIAFTELQSQYFVARDYKHLEGVLRVFEGKMARRTGEVNDA